MVWFVCSGVADDNRSLGDRTQQYLTDLVRLDTSNPPGNESKVAEYLKQVADSYGISAELMGGDTRRLNFVARLRGSGRARPLLLMAHSDVVPVDRSQWSADPFGGEIKNGMIYGRGTVDAKSLLAAELAVMVELKRRNVKLNRDLILMAEADEEAGSTGIQWMIQHAWPKIDAEFALNESGSLFETKDGTKIFQIETSEKIPTRIVLTAKGTAGHASLPTSDNPVLHLARALVKLADSDQPIRLNSTTRRYFREIAKLPDYDWLGPLLPRLDNPTSAQAAASQIRTREPELDALLHTTVTPTMLRGGIKINVIPNTAEAQVDVRRLPNENRDEVLTRLRQIIGDVSIDVSPTSGQQLPATEPSPMYTALYKAIEQSIATVNPRNSVVVPVMSRGATDGAFLRARGMSVYGVPLFMREPGEAHSHGNDERIAPKALEGGVELLWQIVIQAAGEADRN